MKEFNTRYAVAFAAGLLGLALFLLVSTANSGPGFPLDDAWIHQTYARNLALNGRFAFVPGVASAGSTAPLWSLLLALGYLLRLPYLSWTYFLGGLSLLWLIWSAMSAWRLLWPQQATHDWVAGLLVGVTWPLLWAAASGMETLFFAALGMQIISLFVSFVRQEQTGWRTIAMLGFLCGLLILTRPDGLLLLVLVGAGLALIPASAAVRGQQLGTFLLLAALPLLPYFGFNYVTSGTLWPNTLYAKQVEYAAVLARPFVQRLSQLLWLSLGGPAEGWQGMSSPHLLLLPGLMVAGWRSLRVDWQRQRLRHLLPLLWAGGHVFLYAWRLPVTFQHGRYLLPIIPVWVLYGFVGWRWLLFDSSESSRTLWLGQQVARLTFFIITAYFLLQGALAYATDVAIVEGEMVRVAHWLADNTPEDALIASHDIGAIGFFAERPLLDLAGLVSPEIVPLLSDERALSQYVLESDADYLVTAPGWPYQGVAESPRSELVYSTGFELTRASGFNNMAVYRLELP